MTEKDKNCKNCAYNESQEMCHLCNTLYYSHWKPDFYASKQLKAQMTMEHRRPAIRDNAFQKYRRVHRLSQNKLMKILNISSHTVKMLCRGEPPSIKLALKICRKLSIPLVDIIFTPEFIKKEDLTEVQVYGKNHQH